MNTIEHTVSNEEIARRAYELWQERGCPEGDGTEDWEAAKAELLSRNHGQNGTNGTNGRGLLSWWRRAILRSGAHNSN